MAYKYCYRLEYMTAAHGLFPSERVRVDIYDTTEATSTTLVELEGTGEPLKTNWENSGEDKFSQPIRGQRATIQFYSTATVNLLTFCDGDDNRFLVDAYVPATGKRIFKGFVVLDDISEPFQPRPNVVQLTAGDGLGLLKEESLTDTDGNNPRGHYTVIQNISWCLQKTGLELPIYVINNIKEEHDTDKIFYRTCFLEGKSWETDINESEDCYRVLEKILGEDCYLTQYNGAWWIVRIDEKQSEEAIVHEFTYDGTYVEQTSQDLSLFIGAGKSIYFINESGEVAPVRAVKHVKEVYEYQYPRELINNINFERGEIVSTTPITGQDTYDEEKRYAIADWMAHRRYSDKSSETVAEIDYYIVRRFKEGYEVERFIELTSPPTIASPWHHIETLDGTPMMAGDKFTFSVDFRFADDLTGSGSVTFDLGHCRLEGDDGSIYTMDQNGFWHLAPQHREMGTAWDDRATEKENEWMNYSVTSKALPVNGKVYFALYWASENTANILGSPVYYANLDLEYIPLINGNFRKYKGQHHKVSQDLRSKAVREEDVYISDSPKPLFKGAMFYYNGIKHTLAGKFYNGAVVTGTPTASDLHPYGHLQAFSVWNQHNRLMRVFQDCTLQGLNVNGTLPGLIHKYRLSDASPHTNAKYFMLLHGEMDWYLCEWRGTLAEVYDSLNPKVYDDTHEFKYLEE